MNGDLPEKVSGAIEYTQHNVMNWSVANKKGILRKRVKINALIIFNVGINQLKQHTKRIKAQNKFNIILNKRHRKYVGYLIFGLTSGWQYQKL
ncbi:hypothetical protein CO704_22735 [Cedecea neteri]|uniref:Uncharacterized protein n=1 Tax=Cedecea neteri TaxID=158822 RepID=A0A291E3U1_9ENTR|nr:hypothetical protein CO704_22735 [Cedecea neteri]